ncbi:hypothetical protein J6590_023011, partial [Homalodisca vitripennis]
NSTYHTNVNGTDISLDVLSQCRITGHLLSAPPYYTRPLNSASMSSVIKAVSLTLDIHFPAVVFVMKQMMIWTRRNLERDSEAETIHELRWIYPDSPE